MLSLFDRYTEIIPGLYIGNILSATSLPSHITHVINVTPVQIRQNVPCLHIRIRDNEYEHILPYFYKTNHFIETALNNNGHVLVHCIMGQSRSVTIVAAYLLYKKYTSTISSVLAYIKSKRSIALPNSGFIKQLDLYNSSKDYK